MKNQQRTTRNQQLERGFTLVETLVAITLLAIAIAGPTAIAQRGLQGAILARDQLTASYLAQEGIELIRAKRDENYLQNLLTGVDDDSWDDGFETCRDANGCQIDMSQPTLAPTDCTNDCFIYYRAASGLYGHQTSAGWAQTQFKRTIFVTPTAGSNTGYSILSRVEWKEGNRRIDVRETITNWQSRI